MSLHDDRCATRKGHRCNCASAALREYYGTTEPPTEAEIAQAEKELRQLRAERRVQQQPGEPS